MNKLRRDPAKNRPDFPKVDKEDGHLKGKLAGNMMAYADKGQVPQTGHTAGKMPGNMMAYQDGKAPMSFPAISEESKNYGPKPLSEPTRSGFNGKTIPGQMKGYVAVSPNKSEWQQIQSVKKK